MLLLLSCQKFAEGRKLFSDLLALREGLVKEFHENNVDITVSGDRLTVKFVNSPLNSATGEAKQERADAVAAFVKSHYPHPVSVVSTDFVSKRGPLSTTESFQGKR